ncbi:PAC2 family protein [Chloroflexota bacterium]
MRIGAFQLDKPLPDLREPHALAMLRPWIDVGNVGSLMLSRLEALFKTKALGRLARPGNFFDFTRYRPTMYLEEGKREVVIPNTLVTYAKRETGNDFVFLHLLEPHMFGETYVDSVLLLLQKLGVKRYCLLGSMYDFVPHTRPLIVTGSAAGKTAKDALNKVAIQSSDYQGPTTITYLISKRAPELSIETMSLIVHLPQYTQLDEDYMGKARLMEVLCSLYDLPPDGTDIHKAEEQLKQLDIAVEKNEQVKEIMTHLESHYDAQMAMRKEEEMPQLSPEIEKFLKKMEKRFRQN